MKTLGLKERNELWTKLMKESMQGNARSFDNLISEITPHHCQALAKEAVDKLSEDQQKALELVAFKGYSFQKAGERMHVSNDAVKARLFRAKKILTNHLSISA